MVSTLRALEGSTIFLELLGDNVYRISVLNAHPSVWTSRDIVSRTMAATYASWRPEFKVFTGASPIPISIELIASSLEVFETAIYFWG